MDTAAIIAAIGAVPASLAAFAAIIAARRTSSGNDALGHAIEDVRTDIERLSKKLTQHVENRRIHRG